MGMLDGKVIVISGAGPGLGRVTAETVLAEGGSVVLGDLDPEHLSRMTAEIDPDSSGRVVAERTDTRDVAQCERLVELADERFGRLDGVVHVAAISTVMGGLMDGDVADWTAVAETNVKGTLQLTKAAVPLLRKSGGGSVVIIGSIAAIYSVDGVPQIAYGASKAALVGAARDMALELGPDGIRVNTIAPGWKWGAMLEGFIGQQAAEKGVTVEEIMEPVREKHPLRRYTNDNEVANTIAFFCSDLAPSITNQTLYIEGGLTI